MWMAKIITLFPDVFPGALGHSLIGKALANEQWALEITDLRDFGIGSHRQVDDTPIGGGPGMILKPDVLDSALSATMHDVNSPSSDWPIIALSPRGKIFDQELANQWAQGHGITMICGRYEGIDERFLSHSRIEEVSLGDFILSGGEVAAKAMLEATVRLLPNVLGNAESPMSESFHNSLLEYPQFTKPREWCGLSVPEVLLSGHHEKIAQWRHNQAETLTRHRRPDLWQRYTSQGGIES